MTADRGVLYYGQELDGIAVSIGVLLSNKYNLFQTHTLLLSFPLVLLRKRKKKVKRIKDFPQKFHPHPPRGSRCTCKRL